MPLNLPGMFSPAQPPPSQACSAARANTQIRPQTARSPLRQVHRALTAGPATDRSGKQALLRRSPDRLPLLCGRGRRRRRVTSRRLMEARTSARAADAFVQRLGAAAARNASQSIFTDGLMPAVFHQDPRYYVRWARATMLWPGAPTPYLASSSPVRMAEGAFPTTPSSLDTPKRRFLRTPTTPT